MAKTYTKLNIEIDQPITDKIVAVQEDARSRYLDVQLYDDGMYVDLTGQKVRIYMFKPDGTRIMNDGEVTDPTSGRCQFELTTQALAACGVLETQIKVFTEEETEVLSTQVFRIFVTKTLLTNETIESTNEYGSLVILFQNVYEALVLMGEMVENFGKPGEVAAGIPVETFWGMLEELYSINKNMLENSSVAEVLKRIGNYTDAINAETLFGELKALGYIKGSNGSFYETVFQDGTKTLPYERVSDYIHYYPTSLDFDDEYIYVNAADRSVSPYQHFLLKIKMSDFSVVWEKQIQLTGATSLETCTVVDNNYIFVAGGYVLYKFRKSDGYLLGSVSGGFVELISNSTPYMTQDTDYLYGVDGHRFFKKSKSTLETTLTSKDFGNSTIYNLKMLNTESSYLYTENISGIFKFSKNDFNTELKNVDTTYAETNFMTWIVGSYLYRMGQSSDGGGTGRVYKYDTNLNLLLTSNAPYLSYKNSNISALSKSRDGNIVYLLGNNGKPFKMDLSNPSEVYYADSSAPYNDKSPKVAVKYGFKILYLVTDTENNRFRIAQVNTQQKGMSTIKGYQEVTW